MRNTPSTMKLYLVTSTILIAGVQALVVQDGGCNFKLAAVGDPSGQIAQLGDGQNRVGPSDLPVATYTIGVDGGIFDQSGRGCILTIPTTQLQCDTGASPTTGFAIGCDGTLSYMGNFHFVACQTGSNGWNIFTSAGIGQTGCANITLSADSCRSGCPSSSMPSPVPSSPSPPSLPPPPSTCPVDLLGAFEFPHLIIPIGSTSPDSTYGTSYNGQVTKSDIQTIFNFDIPPSYTGKTCSLVFLFPRQDQLRTSAFTISGDGRISFASLKSVGNQGMTFNNAPAVANDFDTFNFSPGNSYTVATFTCPAGTTQSYLMRSAGTDFLYFQDYNPSPYFDLSV
jgi:Ubiquitin 3 binding protein But2 C-terminal domain